MLSKFSLATACVLALVVPAAADSGACSEPIAPAAVDGSTATLQQMKDAVADVKAFLRASDEYQECLIDDYRTQATEARHKKKELDPSVGKEVETKTHTNQLLKIKVGAEYNAAAGAYTAKHPG